jgi:hypothetical protein
MIRKKSFFVSGVANKFIEKEDNISKELQPQPQPYRLKKNHNRKWHFL